MDVPQSTYLSRTIQGGLLVAVPALVVSQGGLKAIWDNHNWIVKTGLVATTLPAAICSLGVAEEIIRIIDMAVRDRFTGNNLRDDIQLKKEVHRTIGFLRAMAFPINGWGVLVKLPVKDHYVYSIPTRIGTEIGFHVLDKTLKVLETIHKILKAVGFYKLIEIAYKLTVKPVLKVVKVVVVTAGVIIAGTLGFARDLILGR